PDGRLRRHGVRQRRPARQSQRGVAAVEDWPDRGQRLGGSGVERRQGDVANRARLRHPQARFRCCRRPWPEGFALRQRLTAVQRRAQERSLLLHWLRLTAGDDGYTWTRVAPVTMGRWRRGRRLQLQLP